jgi:hypothetical protein
MGAVSVQLTEADLREVETGFSRVEIYGGRMDARQMAQVGQDWYGEWQYVEASIMTRIALVTGANRGIGLESARQLAQLEFHVLIAARDEASGGRAVKEIQASGGSAAFLMLDVSDSNSIRGAAHEFGRISDRLDVLINRPQLASLGC